MLMHNKTGLLETESGARNRSCARRNTNSKQNWLFFPVKKHFYLVFNRNQNFVHSESMFLLSAQIKTSLRLRIRAFNSLNFQVVFSLHYTNNTYA